MLSGLCAALAGLVGKFGLSSDLWPISVRGVAFLMMVLLNLLMMTLFARGIAGSNSAVEATLLNTATNLVLTGILGTVFFLESLDIFWWLGSGFIVLGGALVILEDKQKIS